MMDILAAIAKMTTYLAAFSGAGGVLASLSLGAGARASLSSMTRVAGGLLAAAVLTVGTLYILRLGAGLDADTAAIVFISPLGAALGMQILGGLLLVTGRKIPSVFGALLILSAFGAVGHAASHGGLARLAVIAHVAGLSWWFAGLWALFKAGQTHGASNYVALVRRFSRQAVWIVGLLVIFGVITAGLLLEFKPNLYRAYDRVLALKVALTLFLLVLACSNKWIITPRLASSRGARSLLRLLIIAEASLLLSAMAITAGLTTWLSPH
jgi:putative copper export protein